MFNIKNLILMTHIIKLSCGCYNQYGAANCHSDAARLRMSGTDFDFKIRHRQTDEQRNKQDGQTDRHEVEHTSLSDSVHSLA
jgi:hypothetical protein